MATKDELGFRYRTDFADNFTFIGKNNRIVGTLNDDASVDDIDIMIKRALASFYGLAVKNDSDKLLLTEEQTALNIADYFRADDHSIIDYEIKNNTNPNIVEAIISEGELILSKTAVNGVSDLSIIARIHGRDIYVQTDVKIINPTSVYEDFEIAKLEDSIIRWTQSGNADWFVTEEESYFGSKSLRSGEINGGETSAISVELNLTEPGVVVFAYKTSCRDYYNKLNFYIDDLNMTATESPYLWSGIRDWRLMSYSVRSGPRILKWEYFKSPYDPLFNLDRIWIDMVIIPDKFSETTGTYEIHDHDLNYTSYPNPFNPYTIINFDLSLNSQVELMIFDSKGRMVETLYNGNLNKGNHSFNFDGSRLSSGIYYSVLRYGNKIVTHKMILAK
ncbi:MAG: T9SS type A sorting domain-containing protein [Candidatus Delongbacteria bacterium]|nr:T9SS type A sorting domain-containing protein [Candidatus Delongbacteria bacterium]